MSKSSWYQHTFRWGQTNVTEIDPARYDIDWWREQWRRTQVQGVIINAAGIVFYYPSQMPLTHPAEYLNGRDLFGELVDAARSEGLAVLARMDSNRVHQPFYQAHPDWIALDAEGQPYRAGELYITSVDSPYYQEYLPEVIHEIARRYHPDGFADNSFSGLGRDRIDYSHYSSTRFQQAAGLELPKSKDWQDPAFRQWILWSYARRLEIWEINNQVAREAGGAECLWIGMVGGDFVQQGQAFRDLKAIAERAEILLVDSQSRSALEGFKQNTETGLLLHNLLGWDKLIAESMAMYEHAARQPFRVAAKPEPEARLWAISGFAGTIHPWWHHIGAYHEDRRQYRTPVPLFQWHAKNQAYLHNRRPIAPVGLVWSQINADFYGRDEGETRVTLPWQGWTRALIRARIPYQPVHADHIERDGRQFSVLILPNLGAVSDPQSDAMRSFVEHGGSLIATGESLLFNPWGDPRPDFSLADLFGVHLKAGFEGHLTPSGSSWEDWSQHSYLRLHPAMSGLIDGPRNGQETKQSQEQRHPVLEGFEETNLLPFGGRLEQITVEQDCAVPLTFIPPFPVYPPETAWMRSPDSGLPALVLRSLPQGGRAAYLSADVDRCYARNPLPDHARLLSNLVRWAAGEKRLPLLIEGAGTLNACLYEQPGRLVLHLVNLSGTETRPVDEFLPTGPYKIKIRRNSGPLNSGSLNSEPLFSGPHPARVKLLVAGVDLPASQSEDWVSFEIPQILDHEVAIIE